MKRNYLLHIVTLGAIFVFIFLALASSGTTGPATITTSGQWAIDMIKNEWGENTGKFQAQYNGNINGTLTIGTSTERSAITIRSITFSRLEGLKFFIPTVMGSSPIDSMYGDLIIRQENGNEDTFNCYYDGLSTGKIEVEYSEKFRNALSVENIEIRLSLFSSRYRYQFSFPNGFQEAYSLMASKEDSFVLDKSTMKLHWGTGRYVNEWGDSTGQYFTEYLGSIPTWFIQKSRNSNEGSVSKITIKELAFSESEGISFPVTYILASGEYPERIQVTLKQENGRERTFDARYLDSDRKILIPYSEELRNILLLGNIQVTVIIRNTYFEFNYIFKFPDQFDLAYKKLREMSDLK